MLFSRLLSSTPRHLLNIGLAFFLLLLILLFVNSFHSKDLRESLIQPLHLVSNLPSQKPTQLQSQPTPDRRCNAIPSSPDVAVIIKTGANLIYEKLPIQLLTGLQCANDPLIFSDLAQTLGPYRVYDVLEDVSEDIKQSSDFDYYRQLQEFQRFGQDLRLLHDRAPAWKLDRYKFIHMLKKSWNLRPGHDWYIFLEGDTYILWANAMLWLQQFDPQTPYYFGQQSYYKNEPFAHGGSGIIISRGAMEKVLGDDPEFSPRYDKLAKEEVYGDYVLMKALQEKGVTLSPYKPILQGERLSTLRFGPGRHKDERYWCQPLVSLHHVTPSDVEALWQLEQQQQDLTRPILFSDVYNHFMAPQLPHDSEDREDWYNFSEDAVFKPPGEKPGRPIPESEMTPVQEQAYQSYEQCAAGCAEYHRCMQYSYEFLTQQCSYSFSYRLGERRPPTSDGTRYKSGWLMTKINRDIQENKCSSLEWKGFHSDM
ncbi:hypothetical protein BGW36DRAFT_195765 [Talaromyces proteolyticus]|uniref:Apple domain-containing protein n=1 Tax=Talaromyces proteolyticus TaxID=1131652 RepID=A0AAD4KLX6_9EURO|nr:uncharacterized protein BGW36DRAFT_195765 [Talaromyces proteolyticus]KAH8695025.1 hypothetical protein BGW36DRAFT_195765 [Talaromyces proteolyticus]